MADQDRVSQQQADGATTSDDGGLSGSALESAAGGVTGGRSSDGNIIDGCTTDVAPILKCWEPPPQTFTPS